MKKLIKLLAVLVVVIIVALVAAFFYINSIAKTAVERGGTYALGVNTTLKSAGVKPLAGEFTMDGLTVANPDGYKSSHFLTLGNGDVAVSLPTLMKSVVTLPHLNLSDIDMNLEKKDGKANYQTIMDNLKKLSSDKPADPNAKKFVIESIDIRKVLVHVDMMGKTVNVPIESITMKNIGSDGSGVDMGQLTGVITKAVFAAVVESGGGLIPTEMLGDLTSGLAGLANLDKLGEVVNVKALGDLAGKAGEDAKKAAEDLTNKAKEGLGGILGGDKKKESGN